ncbi:MAG: methyltransferase domain-containing protein [Flavobacteriales bacterium]|nr:MAG: methyltransferase domain-containing protein [Flavobacteriales bacterium]
MRSLLSYFKVQKALSWAIRGNPLFVDRRKYRRATLLNVGCGAQPKPQFINLDYHWLPGVDICWDLTRGGLPLKSASMAGVFSEHCIDCIPHDAFMRTVKEIHRVLKPGGVFRLVLPDGELYFDLYQKRKTDKSVVFPYGEQEATGMISINRYAREGTHQYSYDLESLELFLRQAGFGSITRRRIGEGAMQELLIDQQERAAESLVVEAVK